tara:strand:+ start:277 stop:954 length:678 start_codon:yes stop_codon:yes gene_type:complete
MDKKTHIYMMPGLAASSKIFENIFLDNNMYTVHKLDWIQPKKNERFKSFCLRISKKIKYKDPVLLGVSFGGIIMQEIDKIIDARKLIIVSSVKSHNEYPAIYKIARDYQLNNVLPFGMFDNFIKLSMKLNINKLYRRIDLAERYLTERDEEYLEWSVKSLLNWKQDKYRPDIIHIHGDKDRVFPIENISNCITIEGGRHEMIILKAKWFNKNLIPLIEKGKLPSS